MHVSTTEWLITVGVTVAVLLFDVIIVARKPHEPTLKECALYLCGFVGLAIAFGIWVSVYHNTSAPHGDYGLQFFAGWLTEYSLSVDNLFIFLIIMASFNVPRKFQQEALLVGIVLALVFRGIFIALGAVAIDQFSWIFYVFGAFLLYTAFKLLGESDAEEDGENAVVRFARRYFNTTEEWNGLKMFVRRNRKLFITPMFLVVLSLGTTDLLFALDSIPAIFGLTKEPYLVFTANVFALMGLRQLYFLLGDLLNRLVFLSQGLAVLLAFIGVKLVLHALHENKVPFLNGGKPFDVPEIPTTVSLGVIVGTLTITAVVSLAVSAKRDANTR